jgi:hypothetical protein
MMYAVVLASGKARPLKKTGVSNVLDIVETLLDVNLVRCVCIARIGLQRISSSSTPEATRFTAFTQTLT